MNSQNCVTKKLPIAPQNLFGSMVCEINIEIRKPLLMQRKKGSPVCIVYPSIANIYINNYWMINLWGI